MRQQVKREGSGVAGWGGGGAGVLRGEGRWPGVERCVRERA